MVTAHVIEPPDWIPVEYRFLGMDRRRFGLALSVLAIALTLSLGLPILNALIPWNNPTRAGDVLDLGTATAAAPVDWQLQSGSLAGHGPAGGAVLTRNGATISLRTSAFPGTADQYLDQVLSAEGVPAAPMMSTGMMDTGHASFVTTSGLVGALENLSGTGGEVLIAAFKLSRGSQQQVTAAPGLVVEVSTPPNGFALVRADVLALLSSISLGGGQ